MHFRDESQHLAPIVVIPFPIYNRSSRNHKFRTPLAALGSLRSSWGRITFHRLPPLLPSSSSSQMRNSSSHQSVSSSTGHLPGTSLSPAQCEYSQKISFRVFSGPKFQETRSRPLQTLTSVRPRVVFCVGILRSAFTIRFYLYIFEVPSQFARIHSVECTTQPRSFSFHSLRLCPLSSTRGV